LLKTALPGAQLSPADRALCQEIGTASSLAGNARLAHRPENERPGTKSPCKIYCGSASTRFSGSTGFPAHAAFTKPLNSPAERFWRQAGFVNAVLRGYLRETDATQKLLSELKTSSRRWAGRSRMAVARWQKRGALIKPRRFWNGTTRRRKPLRASTR